MWIQATTCSYSLLVTGILVEFGLQERFLLLLLLLLF